VKSDYDSPWKDMLETYFQSALELCFPRIARQINWAKGVQLLSKEFQKIVRRSELGRRNVDVLVQVWSRQGREEWVLLHVEVQAQRDPDFPRRMFDYHSRICQRYQRPVASLAILADAQPRWKPTRFRQALWGCESELRFPVCKLRDLVRNEAALLRNPNPFAIVVLAQLKALQTQGAMRQRRVWKSTLARLGYARNYPERTIFDLFSFVDWVMVLPGKLEREFDQEHTQYEDSISMKYVTNIERRGRAEGRVEGRVEGRAEALRTAALEVLEARFGELPYELREELQALDSEAVLKRLPRLAAVATDPEDFRRQLRQP
jgi:predicted transposase YdaD